MPSRERTYAAACQWDQPAARNRAEIAKNVDHMLEMTTQAVVGYRPLHRIGLVVFPEFAWGPPMSMTAEELIEKQAIDAPNELTDRLVKCAREHGVYIQAGSFIERDARWPGI